MSAAREELGLPEPIARSNEGLGDSSEKSVVEDALANLLGAPFDKVSITMPAALKARIAARAADTNFSAYVSEVLAREERRLALIDFLDYMDDLYGPPSAEDEARLDQKLEAMWAKYEAYQSGQ
jgi:hypothetical protein